MKLFTRCPNGCESTLTHSDIEVHEGVLLECSLCRHLVSPCSILHYEQSNSSWNTEDGTWPSDKDYKRLFKRRKNDIENIAALLQEKFTDIHLLDIGCSNGSGVYIANQLGCRAEGIDPSEKAVNDGILRGLKLHKGFLEDVGFDDESFDAITLYEVIEHVPNPIYLLTECARILKPGGILLIGTGNIDSWTRRARKNQWDFFDMHQHGGHISFYSPKSLKKLGQQVGLNKVKKVTHSVKFLERHECSKPVYRAVKILTELLNFPARLAGKGHQMEVYLQKSSYSTNLQNI